MLFLVIFPNDFAMQKGEIQKDIRDTLSLRQIDFPLGVVKLD